MTNPGFMGQQAAQQAAAAASRAASQQANANYQQTVRHASSLNHQRHYRGGGGLGMFGRVASAVFSLVVLAAALGILLLILSQAQPHLFHVVTTWLDSLT
jgi:hypothetical protein